MDVKSRNLQCQLCGIESNSKDILLAHLKECSEHQWQSLLDANQCNQCKNGFLTKEQLIVHINTCSMEQLERLRQYEAIQQAMKQEKYIMPARETNETNLAKSESIDDDVEENEKDKENVVEYGFNKSNYEHEEMNNTINAPENVDKKEIKNKIIRKLIHCGSKPNECNSCSKIFTTPGSLKRHDELVHQGKRDFKCAACGKCYSTKQHLNMHDNAVHQRRRDYKCDSCKKSFSGAFSLQRHQEGVHKERRNYKCASCYKSFSRAAHLKWHEEAYHGARPMSALPPPPPPARPISDCPPPPPPPAARPISERVWFNCDACEKCFSSRADLRVHTDLMH